MSGNKVLFYKIAVNFFAFQHNINKKRLAAKYKGRMREMKKYVCQLCGYEYDPKKGDEEYGIEAGIEFDELPEIWVCPYCGADKDDFEEIDIED